MPSYFGITALVSSAFHRFHELHSREAVEAFLEFLAARPLAVSSTRLGNYSDPLWETMADLWDPHWAEMVADLLVAWEQGHVMERDVRKVPLVRVRNSVKRLHDLDEHRLRILH